MKKLFTLLLIIAVSELSSQSFSYKYNSWRLGLNIGGMWQTSDVRSTAGVAGGFTLEKGLFEKPENFFSLAIRGRGLFGNTYGLDSKRNYNVANNPALNGTYDPNINYTDTSIKAPYVYNNYLTQVSEGSIELQISFNRLREKTRVILNLWGGVGIAGFRAKTNLTNGGSMYNYLLVDSTGGSSSTLSSHKNLLDKSYESYANGSKRADLITFAPSAGIGLGYQISKGFAIVYEYKITWPMGANADFMDGIVGKNNYFIAGSNDYYHYTGLNLLFTLGKGKTKSTSTTNNNYVPPPTNSLTTQPTNTVQNITTNTQQLKPPVVNFVNPSISPYSEQRVESYNVLANVLNVSNASQVFVTVNGMPLNNFSFSGKDVNFEALLVPGNNTVTVKATNKAGTDSKTTIINLTGQPPQIVYTKPSTNPYTTNVAETEVNATIYNVKSNYDVTVKFNNNPLSNYSYSTLNGQFSAMLPLQKGSNVLEINAVNKFGSDNKLMVINYNQPIAVGTNTGVTNRPVKVTITNPATSPTKVSSPLYNVVSTVTGVSAASQVTVSLNGANIPFNYNGGNVTFPVNLLQGNNSVVVSAKNNTSSDAKSVVIEYEVIKKSPPPAVVITNPQPSPYATSSPNYVFKATTNFIDNAAQAEVKLNGNVVTNFVYNAGFIEYNATLTPNSNNIFEVKVTNPNGSNSASAIVKHEQKVIGQTNQTMVICHRTGRITYETITINVSEWPQHQAHGDYEGACKPVKDPGTIEDADIVICHNDGNGGKQTITIKQSQWAQHQAHGDVQGTCPKVLGTEPVFDPDIVICHIELSGKPTTITIKESQWAQHQSHGDTKGPCPKAGGTNNNTTPDPDIVICHNDGNNGKQTLTIKQSQWAQHQAHGDEMGVCPRVAPPAEEKKITICHIPPGNSGNPQTIEIPESAWSAHQAHGDYKGICNVSGNLGGGNPGGGNSGGGNNNTPEKKITICHIPPGNTGNPQTIEIPESAWTAHQAHGDSKGECAPSNNGNGNNGGGNGNNGGGNNNNTPEKKITICHIPPGNTGNPQTIEIPESAWSAHQAHGDTKGTCAPSNNNNSGNKKITICHLPPGKNQNPQTIEIDESAWPAHQAHGDTKGPCPQSKVGGATPTKGGTQPLNPEGKTEVKTTEEIKTTEGTNIKTGRPR